MLSEIDSILGQNGKRTSLLGGNIGICETSADGMFLIHYFLNINIKEKRPVCFVSLTQSFNHFCSVAQKLGVSLQAARETGYLDFVEGMKHVGDAIYEQALEVINDTYQENEDKDPFSQIVKIQTLQPLLMLLENKIDKLFDNYRCMPVVIIDNLSLLLNIGISHRDIITFLHYLKTYLLKNIKEPGLLITMVTNTENDGQADLMWNYMCHTSSLTLHVAGLQSGYCKDIHGEMSVVWRDGYHKQQEASSQKLQFKLTEKNIKLFAAGMSTIVL